MKRTCLYCLIFHWPHVLTCGCLIQNCNNNYPSDSGLSKGTLSTGHQELPIPVACRGKVQMEEVHIRFPWGILRSKLKLSMDGLEGKTHTHYRYLIWSNDIYRSLKHGFYAPNLFFEYPSNISNSARNRRSILNPPNPLLDSKLSSSVKLGALWRLKMRAAERDHAMGMVFLMLNPHRNRNTVFLLQTFS
jgi:hypothetical protein